ncbi:unnamed protein product [Orchesella dallaii]
MEKDGVKSCCYKTIQRPPESSDDDAYELSQECYPVSLINTTMVPPGHEFLALYCLYESGNIVLVDTHAFVHLKPRVEESLQEKGEIDNENIINIVILGLDTLSHMNFLRSMPNSYSFLTEKLNAIGMNGYNSVGYNTFPNLAAALASLSEEEMKSKCLSNNFFDSCPFIWKKFSENGFFTSFGEDSGKAGGIFMTYWKGFSNPPTDYYLRPFSVFTEEKLRASWDDICYGSRLAWEVLLDYAKKFAYTMGKKSKRYFQFLWSTALTHEGLNDGRLGDTQLLSTLEWFYDEGYLNKTILIVMSDHGARTGAIVDFHQGQLEKRMPFVYFVVPPWFKRKFKRAFENLTGNQDRLTTPYDLYATLADIINLKRITTEEINARANSLTESSTLPRGISLFLPIPLSRTCKMAGIEDHYCVCRSFVDISTSDKAIKQASNYAVQFINKIIAKYSQCKVLSLSLIKSAKIVKGLKEEEDQEQYQILFETKPNNASFEATVFRRVSKDEWIVSGTIDRTNLYGNQSHCVDDREAKLYCYCK